MALEVTAEGFSDGPVPPMAAVTGGLIHLATLCCKLIALPTTSFAQIATFPCSARGNCEDGSCSAQEGRLKKDKQGRIQPHNHSNVQLANSSRFQW